jgi:hypothetical protein
MTNPKKLLTPTIPAAPVFAGAPVDRVAVAVKLFPPTAEPVRDPVPNGIRTDPELEGN